MVPMVTKKALLHDWSSLTAKSCVLWPLETAMKRKLTVRRIQDTTKHGHTDTEKGCNRASGIAVVAGCRNVRGHLYRNQVLSLLFLTHLATGWTVRDLNPGKGTVIFLYPSGPTPRPPCLV